jgi:hypothetical protein
MTVTRKHHQVIQLGKSEKPGEKPGENLGF